jgi:hypothetical protein
MLANQFPQKQDKAKKKVKLAKQRLFYLPFLKNNEPFKPFETICKANPSGRTDVRTICKTNDNLSVTFVGFSKTGASS